MNQRTLIDRLLSPAGFGLVLLLFLFPFITVSCGVRTEATAANLDQRFTFTGLDLIVGGTPDITVSGEDADDVEEVTGGNQVMDVFDERYGKYYPPQPLAIGAAVTILAGMVAALFLPLTRRAWPSAAAAVLAAILLAIEVFIIAPGQADDAIADALGDIEGAPEAIASGALTSGTSPGLGFWLAMVILVGLAAWQAHVAYHGRAAPPDEAMDEDAMDEEAMDEEAMDEEAMDEAEPPEGAMPVAPPVGWAVPEEPQGERG